MAKDCSFDIVSQPNLPEIDNALDQTRREISQRFDFKNVKTTIEREDLTITLVATDDFKRRNVVEILETRLARRGVSAKFLEYGKAEQAFAGHVRQVITIKKGVGQEDAKKMSRMIRDSKIKAQVTIMGDTLRVSGKDKDDLQAVILLIKDADLPMALEFINYR
jgi:uncharacterized protein YajQ (UPF0234 family)